MFNKKKRSIFTWKKYHRWFGLVLSVFMLVFCVSGIILNHRSLFADYEVSRSILPSGYHIKNFNNGIIKGARPIGGDSVLAYGYAGVWLTDKQMQHWQDFNIGLPESVDGRNIRNIIQTKNGEIWCAAMRDIYQWDGKKWVLFALPGNEERIADITLDKDSLGIIAMSRSAIFEIAPAKNMAMSSSNNKRIIKRHIIAQPKDYIPETTLFKTVWTLHSGEYFGLAGRLVVDAIAIILIILSITGIVLFILPYNIRRQKRLGAKEKMKTLGKQMVWHQKWHNKIGYATIILTLWLSITGMCLRPPLMIPLAITKTQQKIKDGNAWHDKLRAIRWDATLGCWLVSTADGFLEVDEHFSKAPTLLDKKSTPKMSPMGITVFEREKTDRDTWIIGSFSGIYRWNPQQQKVADYMTGKPATSKQMMPLSNDLTSGYSSAFFGDKPIVFDYAKGAYLANSKVVDTKNANIPAAMPEMLAETKLSLWNVALELHVGRCYSPFLGPLSELFVFLSGLLITLVLLSGFIILKRRKKKKLALNS